MLIFLPHIFEEQFPYVRQKQQTFSAETVLANISLLRSRLGDTEEVLYLSALVLKYEQYLKQVGGSSWIADDVSLLGADIFNLSGDNVSINDFQSLIEGLASPEGEITFLSDTHTSSGPVLRACKRATPKKAYGVLCVDAHADIYSTYENLWKGNVFSTLIEEGTVSRLLVIGVPQYRIDNVLRETSDDIKPKVEFALWNDEDDYCQKLKWLADGSDEVYVSVDPDGLNSEDAILTAMEYCPFQIILSLGQETFAELDKDSLRSQLNQVLRPPGHIQKNGQQNHKNLYLIGEGGIPVRELLKLIAIARSSLQSMGVEFGLRLEKHLILGDIVELFGIDLLGRTAQAVQHIAKTLVSS